ncbi:MAG: phosphoribosylanthranilate isomerase [Rhodospirillales bacterium]|nr:phosphoribosylanthranilate isomerase [Rhodospirillales bacterium]
MTRIKICGLNDAAGFDAACDGGADYIGLNFFPPSPRAVTPAQAAALAARRRGALPRLVGLFVNPSEAAIADTLAAVPLDILQLYVAPDRAAALRARFALPVWRAAGVSTTADLPASCAGADALLVEAKPPPGATRPGGNAVRFDWSLLAGWTAPCPWLLAGGLTAANVAEAIRITAAPAVDVSSGVERAPGVKDPALIHAFIAAARGAAMPEHRATGPGGAANFGSWT